MWVSPVVLGLTSLELSRLNPAVQPDTLTPEQKQAVRQVLRGKSDREIARLLRQSYRLLNLHRRCRSGVSHRECRTDYELLLLGRMRDQPMERLFHHSTAARMPWRRKRGSLSALCLRGRQRSICQGDIQSLPNG